MANIFPPNTNRRFYGGVALIALAAALALGGVYYVNFQIPEYEPVQPVRFSHKLHAGDLKMSCTACHSAAQRSPRAGIPDTKSCLGCHQHILPDSPLIAPLRAAADPQFPAIRGNRSAGSWSTACPAMPISTTCPPEPRHRLHFLPWGRGRHGTHQRSARCPHAVVPGLPPRPRPAPAPAGGDGQLPLFRRGLPSHAFHPGRGGKPHPNSASIGRFPETPVEDSAKNGLHRLPPLTTGRRPAPGKHAFPVIIPSIFAIDECRTVTV